MYPAFSASFSAISTRLRFVKCQLTKRNTFLLAISLAFLTIMALRVRFTLPALGPVHPRPGSAAASRMVTAWSRGARRRWRSSSGSCSARNIGRRATLLPSPRRRSFLPVSASRWRSLSLSGVLLLRLFRRGLWWSAGGGCIREYILLFSTAPGINARARVRGCRYSFLLLCPLWGCWRRFSPGVGVGAFLRRSESVAGRFCPFSIFPGAKSKIYTGTKLAPLGRFWFRPGGAGLGFCG